MRFHIIGVFPSLFDSYLAGSMMRKATEQGLIQVFQYPLREYSTERHHKVDDRPFGGGPGMVLTAQPILDAAVAVKKNIEKLSGKQLTAKTSKLKVMFFSPSGKQFTNEYAHGIIKKKYTDVVFICGRYEGVDARVVKILKPDQISIGPYVLTGGELPAVVCIDVITRAIPGVLGDPQSLEETRDTDGETYTRPEVLEWGGKKYRVPPVLLSGNHSEIDKWRAKEN